MHTILLPTDFSATARNAAIYALQLAEQLGVTKLVLYHSYEIPLSIDPIAPGLQMLDMDTLKENSSKGLESFKMELLAFADDLDIDTISEYGSLGEGLDKICAETGAGLVIMGITGGGVLEEKLIGSNALSVAKNTKIPVIIVPPKTHFTPISNIMLTSDYDKEDKKVPVNPIRKIVSETKAHLYIFNIEKEEDAAKFELGGIGENHALHSLIHDLEPEYHFSTNTNYTETVNDFALEYRIDLIISIEKKRGFFANLFSTTHTNQLAFHSHIPVMVVHE